ncbi:hypothetical protein [Thermococcus aggregans]|nr:hypothetical protein [Thermococcus aggregans]
MDEIEVVYKDGVFRPLKQNGIYWTASTAEDIDKSEIKERRS